MGNMPDDLAVLVAIRGLLDNIKSILENNLSILTGAISVYLSVPRM